jgi:hypothetical protein
MFAVCSAKLMAEEALAAEQSLAYKQGQPY